MKNLLWLLVFVGAMVAGQENTAAQTEKVRQNEISINLPVSIFAEFPMFSYERLTSADLGFGTSAGFAVGEDGGFDGDLNFEIVPFVRWYFLNSGNETIYGRRFFIEANAGIFGYEKSVYNAIITTTIQKIKLVLA